MSEVKYEKRVTALVVIDPYNDFISEGGKLWNRVKAVAEANRCVPNMLRVLNTARNARLRIFYALHHRYRTGDYETWKNIAPVQKAAWEHKVFEDGTWGEIRSDFKPHPGLQSRKLRSSVLRKVIFLDQLLRLTNCPVVQSDQRSIRSLRGPAND
jgi:ureidoacrylate peracid hydrolase